MRAHRRAAGTEPRIWMTQYRNRSGAYRTQLVMGAREVRALLAEDPAAVRALADALEAAEAGHTMHESTVRGSGPAVVGCKHPDRALEREGPIGYRCGACNELVGADGPAMAGGRI